MTAVQKGEIVAKNPCRVPGGDNNKGAGTPMSQEERDRRLGLTGLTPAEREQRIAELEDQLNRKQAAAEEALARRRGAAAQDPSGPALHERDN